MKLGAAVARRLRRFRHQSGLTQEELAARAGLNRNHIGMIEREENSPTVDTLEKLAAVLKIEPKLFFADDELISDAVGLQGSSQSTRKGHPLAREGGGGSRRRP
jgi:transcriptional regulator with XRE-family HTH domain